MLPVTYTTRIWVFNDSYNLIWINEFKDYDKQQQT